jgi:hypothetical protein
MHMDTPAHLRELRRVLVHLSCEHNVPEPPHLPRGGPIKAPRRAHQGAAPPARLGFRLARSSDLLRARGRPAQHTRALSGARDL